MLDGQQLVRVGVSVGVAVSSGDGDTLEALHRKADAALYHAKLAGKGRHCRALVEADAAA